MRKLKLEKTAYDPGQLPGLDLPQVAMAGRSNVGKSSLINSLAGRKSLAKTSSTPGKTRSINFYLVQPDSFYLVDLPGYGYARCSRSEREKFRRLIQAYFQGSSGLRAVVLLLDSRHKPQVLDLELVQFARAFNLELIPVMTKADKCRQSHLEHIRRIWDQLLGLDYEPVVFSARTGLGREHLWSRIVQAAAGRS